jgi:hypothetical protein
VGKGGTAYGWQPVETGGVRRPAPGRPALTHRLGKTLGIRVEKPGDNLRRT